MVYVITFWLEAIGLLPSKIQTQVLLVILLLLFQITNACVTENKLNEIDDDTFKSVMNELSMQVQSVYVLKHVNPETDKVFILVFDTIRGLTKYL